MRTLILGVGNPILGDDGAGIATVRKLERVLKGPQLDIKEAATGGIPLVEQMLDYSEVILVDAMLELEPGVTKKLTPSSLEKKGTPSGLHGMDFLTSFEIMKSMYPDRMPDQENILIYGIGIEKNQRFSETISPEVREGVEDVYENIRSKFNSREMEEEDGSY